MATRPRILGQLLIEAEGLDPEALGEALGPERLHLLHVDNGLMRKDESRQVLELFKD